MAQYFLTLGIPLTVIFASAARNNVCSSCSKNFANAWFTPLHVTFLYVH